MADDKHKKPGAPATNEEVVKSVTDFMKYGGKGLDSQGFSLVIESPAISKEMEEKLDSMHGQWGTWYDAAETPRYEFKDGNFKMKPKEWQGLLNLAKDVRQGLKEMGKVPQDMRQFHGGQALDGNVSNYTDEELAAFIGAQMIAANVHQIHGNPNVQVSEDKKHLTAEMDGVANQHDMDNSLRSPELTARIAQQILGDNTKTYETGNLTPTNTAAADADFVEKGGKAGQFPNLRC